jgi:hypothetical protein
MVGTKSDDGGQDDVTAAFGAGVVKFIRSCGRADKNSTKAIG